MRVVIALLAAALFGVAPALADSPSVGVDADVVAGRQKQSSQNSTSLPTVPVPMFNANVPLKRFAIFAEGTPPIGPVSYGDGTGSTQATKISYLTFEGRWRISGDRFALGIGSTLVNQATFYSRFGLVDEQSSRVAGLRFSTSARVEDSLSARTELTAAFSPSMHGLQSSYLRFPYYICPIYGLLTSCRKITVTEDSEFASLVDLQAVRTQQFGSYALRYGFRYINYSARFPNGAAADRERLVMPFVGMQFSIR